MCIRDSYWEVFTLEDKDQVILSVKDLSTSFFLREGEVKAVDGVSFSMKKGECLALVGESGSGKTVTALSMLRLVVWPPGKIKSGEVILDGQNVFDLPMKDMRNIRGKGIAMILQEPMSSLNPSQTIGRQIQEAIEINQGIKGEEAKKAAIDMLNVVRIPSPEKRYYNYPHELSGGMKQRIMIAIALSCRPKVLIADEPTCSLDVTIQAQILRLMKQLRKDIDTTIMFITSDLGLSLIHISWSLSPLIIFSILLAAPAPWRACWPDGPWPAARKRSFPLAAAPRVRTMRTGRHPSPTRCWSGCRTTPG